MNGAWDLDTATYDEANSHHINCPRRQEFYNKEAEKREMETRRKEAERREIEARRKKAERREIEAVERKMEDLLISSSTSPVNRADEPMILGRDGLTLYCGRYLGTTVIPRSDGRCGPNNGPQCPDCSASDPHSRIGDTRSSSYHSHHRLVLTDNLDSHYCNICRLMSGVYWRCQSCDFDECVLCALNETRIRAGDRDKEKSDSISRILSTLTGKRGTDMIHRTASTLAHRAGSSLSVSTLTKDAECKQACDISEILIARSPYREVTFNRLITQRPTGQAIVMGATYKSQKVAIKIYLSRDESAFATEISNLKELGSHEHIMSIIKHFETPRAATIFPLAENGDLASKYRERALSCSMVIKYGMEIALGLIHIHSHGIAHLDIKSENILIDRNDRAMITDFGLSMKYNGNDKIIEGRGTTMFIAPEGFEGKGRRSDASKMDVYAFGMVIYELLAGRLPYESLHKDDLNRFVAEVMDKVITGQTPDIDPRWSTSLVSVMRRCWASRPNDRPSMNEVRRMMPSRA